MAELEKEDKINNNTKNKQKTVNNNLAKSQNNGSDKITDNENKRKNNKEEITENDKTNNFTAGENNQEIKENKGTQFSPKVVDPFLEIVKNKKPKKMKINVFNDDLEKEKPEDFNYKRG